MKSKRGRGIMGRRVVLLSEGRTEWLVERVFPGPGEWIGIRHTFRRRVHRTVVKRSEVKFVRGNYTA